MQITNVRLADLKPYGKNPRRNDEAVGYVAESIREFGFKVPIVVDAGNVIVAGHTRYKAAKRLGMEEVPCVVADDLTEEQVKAFRLADNKVAEKAEWDFNLLDAELAGIFDIDMSDFGFDDLYADDGFGTDFELADGGKSEICQMTLTLHQRQKELIEYAIGLVDNDIEETFGNTNRTGNAVYEVVRQWAALKR